MLSFWNPLVELKRWWHEYAGDKCDWWLFYNRMNKLKRPKEEAILKKLPSRAKEIVKPTNTKEIVATRLKEAKKNHRMETEAKYNPSYYVIEVTYPTQEEREIFNRAYMRQIEMQERKVFCADTPTQYVEENKKLMKLQSEYKTFLTFNQWICLQQSD